jgi:hypothetical protein
VQANYDETLAIAPERYRIGYNDDHGSKTNTVSSSLPDQIGSFPMP